MDNRVEDIPVFVNKPIKNESDDYIGINTYAEVLDAALKNSSTVGIVADYGTGKSSLVDYYESQYLKKDNGDDNDKNYKIARLNLWDASKNETGSEKSMDVHCHLLNQLALDICKERYGRYVNKRLNKNYGFISFDTSNHIWLVISLFIIFILIYWFNGPLCEILWGNKCAFVVALVQHNVIGYVSMVGAAICAAIAISKANIVFSIGKNEKVREINANDIVEIYLDILKKRKKDYKNKTIIIVIEDLDRSSDFNQIKRFLKEMNRFYIDSLVESKNKVKFIVDILPESKLDDKDNDKRQYYSKFFNYVIHMRPVRAEDYGTILNGLLLSKKSMLKKLGIEVGEDDNINIPGMSRIIYGKDLTLRDVKERLNTAIQLYAALRNRAGERKDSIDFEKCAYIAYLENAYPDFFLELYSSDPLFDIIREYAVSAQSEEIKTKLNSTINNTLEKTMGDDYPSQFNHFVEDITSAIQKRILEMDYGMYLFNYPKNSKFRDVSEKTVYDAIVYNDDFGDGFEEMLTLALINDPDILSEAFDEWKELKKSMPDVAYKNQRTFEFALKYYQVGLFGGIKDRVNLKDGLNQSLSYLESLFTLPGMDWSSLNKKYAGKLSQIMSERLNGCDNTTVYKTRRLIIDHFSEDILLYKQLFSAPHIAISKEEMTKIDDAVSVFGLSDNQELDTSAISALVKIFIEKGASSNKSYTGIVTNTLTSAISRTNDLNLVSAVDSFVRETKEMIPEFDNYLFGTIQNGAYDKNQYQEILNMVGGKGVADGITNKIRTLDLRDGFTHEFLKNSIKGRDNALFVECIFKDHFVFKEIEEDFPIISQELVGIYNQNQDLVLAFRRHLLSNNNVTRDVTDVIKNLFESPLPIIKADELQYADNIINGIQLIDLGQMNSENIEMIADYFNKVGADRGTRANRVIHFIEEIPDNVLAKDLFSRLDYKRIDYHKVGRRIMDDFIEQAISRQFLNIDDAKSIISFMQSINMLRSNLETRIIGKITDESIQKGYTDLVNQVPDGDITELTLEVIEHSGEYGEYNEPIQLKLFNSGLYEDYVYAKTMGLKEFVFEKNRIEDLKSAYKNLFIRDIITDKMKKCSTLMKYAYDNKWYQEQNISSAALYTFADMKQTNALLDTAFSKAQDIRKEYLLRVKGFENDSVESYYITLAKCCEVIHDDEIYSHIRSVMKSSSCKGKYYRDKKLKR